MTMQSLSDVIVFDLDDTLYKEVSYVESGFRAVARHLGNLSLGDELISSWRSGTNAFNQLINKYSLPFTTEELLEVYRSHFPEIKLDSYTYKVLDALVAKGKILGIITDGRSLSQHNKIQALGLSRWISSDNIVISEEFGSAKPDVRNYRYFMTKYPSMTYAYIGDNMAKDFLAPKSLGWQTICLKNNGQNIHPQNLNLSKEYLSDITITSILEIKYFL